MNDDELDAYLIHHLGEYDNPNDLILEICEKTGRPWAEVQAKLERVRSEHEREITLRQSPVMVIAAVAICLLGFGIAIYGVYMMIAVIQAYTATPVAPLEISDALQAIAASGYVGFGGLLVGAAMVMGSILGMRKVWAAILKI